MTHFLSLEAGKLRCLCAHSAVLPPNVEEDLNKSVVPISPFDAYDNVACQGASRAYNVNRKGHKVARIVESHANIRNTKRLE